MITNQVVFYPLFFFELVINLEKLLFGLELLVHVDVIITSEVDEAVAFKFA